MFRLIELLRGLARESILGSQNTEAAPRDLRYHQLPQDILNLRKSILGFQNAHRDLRYNQLPQDILILRKSILGSQKTEEAHSDNQLPQDILNLIPQDILNLILQRLRDGDHIRLGAVCTSLSAAIARAEVSPLLEFPLVMHASVHPSKDDHLFSSLAMDKFYTINPVRTRGRKIVGMVEGRWFIMRGYSAGKIHFFLNLITGTGAETIHFFLNLITGEEIMLPALLSTVSTTNGGNPSLFKMIVASTEPINPDCLVAGITEKSLSGFWLAFCRITDTKWTLLDQDDTVKNLKFETIIFCDGKLYASTTSVHQFLVVFDLRGHSLAYKAQKIVIGPPRPIPHKSAVRKKGLEYHFSIETYTLAADSVSTELLLILHKDEVVTTEYPAVGRNPFSHAKHIKEIGFRLFKLDMDHFLWIEIADMGDRLLFIGTCSFFVSLESLGEAIEGNCIYYSSPSRDAGAEIGRFCLTDKTITRFPPKSLALNDREYYWFMPTINELSK